MIHGSIYKPESFAHRMHPIWAEVFKWVKKAYQEEIRDGEYDIIRNIRAIVQTVTTTPRSERHFEAHRRNVDLHVCLDGSEFIEYVPVTDLTAETEYNDEKDYTLYALPETFGPTVAMVKRGFAVYFPGDAHMPGIYAAHPTTRKIVVKIPVKLLS